MAIDFPSDLIRQLQISLRKEAGVPCYDPDDPTLAGLPLPSLQEAIGGLNSSPPYLRCKQCRGGLYRGLQSIICVYCGAHQHKDIPPDSIPFKSTLGYRCLLQSLRLDGSEAVESSKSDKGQNNSAVLSDLFDIELKWSTESNKKENDVTNKAPHVINSRVNLTGVDLDNFFSETKKERLSGSGDQLLPNESSTSPHNGNLSLFENEQSTETLVGPTKGAVGDSSSSWEAEFKSAEVSTFSIETNSVVPFQDAFPVDLSRPFETAFGSEAEIKSQADGIDNNIKTENVLVQQASVGDTWILDDQWHSANKKSTTMIETDTIEGGPLNNSYKDALFQEDLWLNSSEKHGVDEESLDDWQDFTSSVIAPELFPNSLNLTSPITASTDELGTKKDLVSLDNGLQKMEFGGVMASDLFSESPSHHIGSSPVNQVQGSYSGSLMEVKTSDPKSTQSGDAWSENADNTVEMLMSQMHDLSFMLDSDLSVPQKEDPVGSTS